MTALGASILRSTLLLDQGVHMSLRRKKMRKSELLRVLPELAEAPDKDLNHVSRLFDEIDYPAGTVMIREGEIGQQAFLIVDGSVGVTLRQQTLAILEPGDIVGEMSLMDGEPRS